MNKRIIRLLLILAASGALATTARAGAVIEHLRTQNGKVYRDVKWGPINNGKVVAFHSRGVAIIPLADLPEEYRAQFGEPPPTAPPAPKPVRPLTIPNVPEQPVVPAPVATTTIQPPPSAPLTAADLREQLEKMRSRENNTVEGKNWRQYCDERTTKVVLEGKLVEKARLSKITGFIVSAKSKVQDGDNWHNATMIELAVKRADAKDVSAAMELRPALWRSTGEQAWLLNYRPEGDFSGLVRVYGVESKSLEERRSFIVGREPSFEEWLKLRNKP